MSELQKNVVLVKSYEQRSSQKPIKTGTGFFVDTDGSVLTCFHVVGEPKSKKLYDWITITFNGEEREVACIFSPPEPEELDFAILRPKDHKLPTQAVLIQLGKWESKADSSTDFQTFGYSLLDTFDGLLGEGIIKGKIHKRFSKSNLLQLTSQTIGAEDIQPGMSGAPIFDTTNEMIVGMINVLYKDQRNNIPFAIPIEYVAEKWENLKLRIEETELIQELSDILSNPKWFSEDGLEAFYRNSPIFGIKAYEEFEGGHKASQIVRQFRGKRRRLFEFVNYLLDQRTDIKLSARQQDHHIRFINREIERKEACDQLFAPPYIIFEAPAGYGKTELLKVIQRQQFKDNWACIYVELPEEQLISAFTLAEFIAQDADFHDPFPKHLNLDAIGFILGGYLYQLLNLQKKKISGLVLLIDSIERLPETEIDRFVNQFLPALQTTLQNVSIRIRFAGRNVGSLWVRHSTKFPLKIVPLSPFRFKFVQETVKRQLPNIQDHDTFAAHLMHITGGHPGCMAEIIEGAKVNDQNADTYFQERENEHRKIILKYANKTREAIPENLLNTFDILSVFRRYNLRLLQKMIEEEIIEYSREFLNLERELTATYLVKRRNGFIQDDIVRRLLALRLRWEEPDKFLDLCSKAKNIYYQDLESPYSREEQHIAIESIFGELMAEFYQTDQSIDQRKLLKESFFSSSGILHKYLASLNSKRFSLEIKQNLVKLLEDENGEEDWEFRFIVNFFMRADQYNNEPFDELLKQVKAFSES